jgi:hypothetical protein
VDSTRQRELSTKIEYSQTPDLYLYIMETDGGFGWRKMILALILMQIEEPQICSCAIDAFSLSKALTAACLLLGVKGYARQ